MVRSSTSGKRSSRLPSIHKVSKRATISECSRINVLDVAIEVGTTVTPMGLAMTTVICRNVLPVKGLSFGPKDGLALELYQQVCADKGSPTAIRDSRCSASLACLCC